MKKSLVLLLVMIMLAVSVTPALAGGNNPGQGTQQGGPRGTFALVGKITSIDILQHTLTVEILKGNKLVQSYIGQEIVINTAATTRYLAKTVNGNASKTTFENLMVGDAVSINGKVANGIWTAKRITVGPNLDCLP